jgi:hypothetical protein
MNLLFNVVVYIKRTRLANSITFTTPQIASDPPPAICPNYVT